MQLTFLGAAHEVTGSCTLLTAAGQHLLVDCGMEQGRDMFENQEIPVAPNEIDAVLLTHAHIDHSGKIPMLYAEGFRGRVFATRATCRLCELMLRDSAHIQESEAAWRNRKAKRAGTDPYVPLYTMQDVEGVLPHFVPCEYEKEIEIAKGVTLRFTDAGHLLGSSSVTATVTENGQTKRIASSGDVGNVNKPILRDPQPGKAAEDLLIEPTYGDRRHESETPDYVGELAAVIRRTFDRGGNVVIPSFAVGRTQELLYFIRQIKEQNLVPNHPDFAVVVDSPMAVEATKLFSEDARDCYDAATLDVLNSGRNPLQFSGLTTCVTTDESRAINEDTRSKVILSASGMCEAGRIRHHLKHNLWRPESTVLFVGYQTAGTVGRALLDGTRTVKLFGEEIAVRAEIVKLNGISGHADCDGLLRFVKAISPTPVRVFVNHGEEAACEAFAATLTAEGIAAVAPFSGDGWDLLADAQVTHGGRKRIARRTGGVRENAVFTKLVAAGQRLMRVIDACRGRANKDLAKFTAQIVTLCEKWEK